MTDLAPDDLDALAERGGENLRRVIAIDSQSDDRSDTIPSTEGQRRLSAYLDAFFGDLGFETRTDDNANLIAARAGEGDRKLCFMVHIDTARGTHAIDELVRAPAWDGGLLAYPDNSALEVSVDRYPETAAWIGQDVLHGRGDAPIGLDDKLGMSELMTLGEVLAGGRVAHPPLVFVFRPDEEIGRMAAVEGLARELAAEGVSCGYTVDGITPFEVNVENFHASRAVVTVAGRSAAPPRTSRARRVRFAVRGCKSHGATAKAERYLNATVVLARVLDGVRAGGAVLPVGFQSDVDAETDAELELLVFGDNDEELEAREAQAFGALKGALAPHAWRGAGVEVLAREEVAPDVAATDDVLRAFEHLRRFLESEGPEPLLSEDSEKRQGYSNPYFVHQDEGAVRVEYRLRDFERDALSAREQHVRAVAELDALPVEVTQQYVNMGDRLAPHPELIDWAQAAAAAVGETSVVQPIRGGTGVDPFLDAGIPVANLGTGYFSPESEKELTSRQMIARHVRWLAALLEEIVRARA